MSIKINYLEKLDNKPFENLVLFVDENFNIKDIKNIVFFELILKKSIFFFKSLVFNKSDM